MDQQQQESFRIKLKDLTQELQDDLAANQDSTKTVELDTSIGRLSRMDAMQSQQMALELRRRQQNQLQRAESALQRIDKGTYGKCGRCHKDITLDRLDIQPDAVLCVGCAETR
ncbi:TraR/DksA C4-type zinc finger protein [bacterium]|jgi:DnaK suppressor protein|nr:TraR/DksA C4-type zinc finger protein [Verrucomicrobiota bacterium]MDA7645612.1 TraR/DksA C4-type zinc finger protein [bacterium]